MTGSVISGAASVAPVSNLRVGSFPPSTYVTVSAALVLPSTILTSNTSVAPTLRVLAVVFAAAPVTLFTIGLNKSTAEAVPYVAALPALSFLSVTVTRN